MKYIAYEELPSLVRKQLIEQTQLDPQFVRNAASIFGAGNGKTDDNTIFTSITKCEAVLFFLITKRDDNNCVTQSEDDDIVMSQSYDVKVMIYGDKSASIASNCIARLRKDSVRQTCQRSGFYISHVSNSISSYEFKSMTNWLRNDFTISICCEHLISEITEDVDFDTLNTLSTIRS